MSWGHSEKMNASLCCEFLLKCDEIRKDGNTPDCEIIVIESSSEDDNIPISNFLCRWKIMKKEITVPGNNQELLPITQSQSSFALNDETARERETLVESTPISGKLEASNGKRDEDGDEPSIVTEMVPPHSKDNNDKGGCKLHLPDGIKLASDGPNADTKDRNHAEFLSSSPVSMASSVNGYQHTPPLQPHSFPIELFSRHILPILMILKAL